MAKRSWAKRSQAALKAWKTRRWQAAFAKARAAEAASKQALQAFCQEHGWREHGWRVIFLEGPTGAPRTGVVDAIAVRVSRKNADALDFRLIQLKGGKAGISGREIARLKQAAVDASVNWLIAAFDGEVLHFVPDLSKD